MKAKPTPMPFTTILGLDFETANGHRSSVCSMGLCLIDAATGEVTAKHHMLINPHQNFSHFNITLHGITPTMVAAAPSFPVAMACLSTFIDEETVVVAHNAPFETSCINRGCEAYGIPMPSFTFVCTLALARALITGIASYALPSVGIVCGLPMFNHHRADDDAEACARIFLHLARHCQTTDLQQLSDRAGISIGTVTESDFTSSHLMYPCENEYTIQGAACPIPTKPRSRTAGYFTGRTVVFTGTLLSMPRLQAEHLIVDMGGAVANNVTKKVNYVICGYIDPALTRGKEKSTKLIKAESLIEDGYPLQILDESEFYAMIDG